MSAECPQPDQSQDHTTASPVRGLEFLGTDPDDLRIVPYEGPPHSVQGQKGKSSEQSQKGKGKGQKGKGPTVHYNGPDNTFANDPPEGYKDVVCLA